MSEDLDLRIRKRLSGACRDCAARAADGSDYCEKHDAMARARSSKARRKERKQRAEAGLCRDGCGRRVTKRRRPGGGFLLTRCVKCKKAHAEDQKERRGKRGVLGADRGVVGDSDENQSRDASWRTEKGTHAWGSGEYQTTRYHGIRGRGRLSREEQIAELRRDLMFAREKLDEAIRVLPVLASPDVLELGPIQRAAAAREAASPAEQASRLIDDVVEKLTA